jgi:pSer/pThr/pTyr-binding forkhead associated (FHA) protein
MTQFAFIEDSPSQGLERPAGPDITFGREGCDVLLDDPEVSRRHAALRSMEGGLGIEDLASSNGTYVNEARISQLTLLREGDTVRLGNTILRLTVSTGATRISGSGPEPAAAPATAAPVPEQPVAPAPEPAPPPPTREPPASAPQPPAPVAQQAPASRPDGRRGDVPAPDLAPSAIRRTLPPELIQRAPEFAGGPGRGPRGSAARRLDATVFAFPVVVVDLIALLLYFAWR